MLSLNSLSTAPTETPIAPQAKAKARPADEQKPQTDFSAYMAAMVQPVKTEAPHVSSTRPAEAPVTEKPVAIAKDETVAVQEKPQAPTNETQTQGAQKAGHESPEDAKAAQTKPVRSDKELLEALGLIAKKNALSANAEVQKAVRPGEKTATPVSEQVKNVAAKGDKSQVATTLQQLQKSPDLLLSNAEGLKRLGEKLGLAFLGKMSEKLGEKAGKTDNSTTQTKTELKSEIITQTTTTKAQKAGDASTGENSGFQNAQKSPKGVPVKIVSRETIAADASTAPGNPGSSSVGGSDLKPVSLPETATGRLTTSAAVETRLAEATAGIRASENIRTAVENPLMRADLVRQFNEVMGRAQVLVADSQNAQFSVKLYPRELGRMEIDLKLVEGEIRGKIVVESEDVKNEMQNFLKQRENSDPDQQMDLNRIDIEVRSGNQHAQNPERTTDAEALLQNLVTRAAANAYELGESVTTSGSALYA